MDTFAHGAHAGLYTETAPKESAWLCVHGPAGQCSSALANGSLAAQHSFLQLLSAEGAPGLPTPETTWKVGEAGLSGLLRLLAAQLTAGSWTPRSPA